MVSDGEPNALAAENPNDDDQVDAGEPKVPAEENPDDDAIKVSDDDDSDDVSSDLSYVKMAKKGSGFDEFETPSPDNLNHDHQVDTGEPTSIALALASLDEAFLRRSCRSLKGCGRILCDFCYPE